MAASPISTKAAVPAAARRRLPAEERRRAVLDAARDVFARRGYHGAGIAEIASTCGCSEPILYRHFASKQALFAAVLVDAAALLRARIAPLFEEAEDPLEALVAVAATATEDELFIQISRLRMLAATLVSEPEIQEALAQTVTEMHGRLTGLMARAREHGSLRPDIDPGEAAWLWFGVALQVGYRGAVFGSERLAEPRRTATALIDLLTSPRPAAACPPAPARRAAARPPKENRS